MSSNFNCSSHRNGPNDLSRMATREARDTPLASSHNRWSSLCPHSMIAAHANMMSASLIPRAKPLPWRTVTGSVCTKASVISQAP
ncbi:hypothetical protein I7I50_00558 [Histoplasma capsulatum G186AR]|uniref:Uncharacterized protein n=1 Tax=Ajellomyces capsulatus TaxID=5037 RepID=A0A8H8CU38_AJECA|nr:hypothetical protein I7I52_07826 [Histoplasma capsulatum]QSS72644.1 hypothetical protein I7I50_00558 [Histoplasma capsulatum G186AR]